jgi:hypothetical protein
MCCTMEWDALESPYRLIRTRTTVGSSELPNGGRSIWYFCQFLALLGASTLWAIHTVFEGATLTDFEVRTTCT